MICIRAREKECTSYATIHAHPGHSVGPSATPVIVFTRSLSIITRVKLFLSYFFFVHPLLLRLVQCSPNDKLGEAD